MKMLVYILAGITLLVSLGIYSLYTMQEKLIFHPEAISRDYTYTFQGNFEELFLKSKDSEINAIHFKNKNPKGIIVYFHGNAGSLNTWGLLGEEFMRTGYDFLVFDYRGYGKSTGKRSERAFIRDGRMVYNYAKKFFPENKIIVYGRSLGTGFATKIASENAPKALILETPYYNFLRLARHYFPYVPMSLILNWRIRTDKWIRKVKAPILIFHGTADETIPYSHGLRLKKFLKPGDSFVTIPHAMHNNIPLFPEYAVQLERYL